jgi:hypothetical protein
VTVKINFQNNHKRNPVGWLGSLVQGAEAKQEPFVWRPFDVIGLAERSCAFCGGSGFRSPKTGFGLPNPCGCVLRSIFRTCYRKFLECTNMPKLRKVSFWRSHGAVGKLFAGMHREEYIADFTLISRRVLSDSERQVFAEYFLFRRDLNRCCQFLRIDQRDFVSAVRRIEEKCGRAFRETRPYSLFPISEYFEGSFFAEPNDRQSKQGPTVA